MSLLIPNKSQIKYLLTLLLLSMSFFCFSQIRIEIQNNEIEDVSAFSVSSENNEAIKLISFKVEKKTIIIQDQDYKSIRLSHIGYFDTLILLKSLNNTTSYKILLTPKITELTEVVVKELKSFTHKEDKGKKGKSLLFNLDENKTWYFNINLNTLQAKRLDKLSVLLSRSYKEDKIEVVIFKTINDAVSGLHFYRDTIELNNINENIITVLSCKENNLFLNEDFIIGFKLLSERKDKSKSSTSILTKFQKVVTQIYYQTEKGIIHKMPTEHYFKYFQGYPILVNIIEYEK